MHPTTEIRNLVKKVLDERGVRRVNFTTDGATHQVASFDYRSRLVRFHFPNTISMNGRSRLNTVARLRRKLREIDEISGVAIAPKASRETQKPKLRKPLQKMSITKRELPPQAVRAKEPETPSPAIDLFDEFKRTQSFVAVAIAHRMAVSDVIRLVHAKQAELKGADGPKPTLLPRKEHRSHEVSVSTKPSIDPRLIKRNRKIVAKRASGASYAEIGREYLISGARVKQIIIQMGALDNA